ncbi:MAG: Gfo/Idh/MocA family protein [Planctomycetota bacterium]
MNEGGKVRYGVIGCGVIGPVHADAVVQQPDAALVASCDVIRERAERCAEQFGGAAHADYREMLAGERLDAVSVCTPHDNHAETTVACLEAGVDVLCEKPLAISSEQLDRMVGTARDEGRILAGVFQHRFDPTTATIKRALDEGLFGEVLNAGAWIRCRKDMGYYGSGAWRGTWAGEGGGVVINQGIHSIDIMQWLAGPVKTVFGRWTNFKLAGLIEAEDTAGAFVEFASGALGSIEASSSSHLEFEAGVHLYGTHGSFRLSTGWPNDLVRLDLDGGERTARLREMLAESRERGEISHPGKDYYGNSHVRQVADFVAAVREGRAPFVSGEDARHAVEIVLAIYESARTGRPVDL